MSLAELIHAQAPATKSNPVSPEKSSYDMKLDTSGGGTEGAGVKEAAQSTFGGSVACRFPSCCAAQQVCPFASTSHVHCSQGVMSRSKSLDDLTSVAFVSEDSSCSTDLGSSCGAHASQQATAAEARYFTIGAGPQASVRLFMPSLQQPSLQPLMQQPSLASDGQGLLRCSHVPVHHHSHHQLQSSGHSSSSQVVPPCDSSSLYDSVVQRMNHLEMN